MNILQHKGNKLQHKELEGFYKQFPVRNYKKGELLIRADDEPQGIFCLIKGYVRQYTISKTGLELTIHILKPPAYFPMVWAINGPPNIYYFEAVTPVEAGRASKEEIIRFIKDKPDIIFQLLSKLAEHYVETLTRIEHLVFSDAYRRVISVLLYLAKHFGEEKDNGIIVPHHFTQQDIATLVGVARETACVELTKLQKKGLLKCVDHSMFFKNIKQLELELSQEYKNEKKPQIKPTVIL